MINRDFSRYPFSESDFKTAADEWGCNCGPTALAFVLGAPLSYVKGIIPHFKERRYTSPAMMKSALKMAVPLGWRSSCDMFDVGPALVRIQWHGPWKDKWTRWRSTHWIATIKNAATRGPLIFDCNGGVRTFDSWKEVIVPCLAALHEGADGTWSATHVLRLY